MGSGEMEKWVFVEIPFDILSKRFIGVELPYKTNIPLFHYSIIPSERQKQHASTICSNLINLYKFRYANIELIL